MSHPPSDSPLHGREPHSSSSGGAKGGPEPTSALLNRLSKYSLKESRYALEGEIARGGMGAIQRIWDADLRRHLAKKVALDDGDGSSGSESAQVETSRVARFLEEAQITGQLDHAGIVPVHELGLDPDGRAYFTMKLVEGRDLSKIFDLVFEAKEGWNEMRAMSVMLRVCEAMSYAHAKGVIHRDLKPANVMVGNFGEVYVMDWGLARVLGQPDAHDMRLAPELARMSVLSTERADERRDTPDSPLVTRDGVVVGTPAYMPPEQARGEIEKLTPRADVYAIGAMLYHLLARHMPYVEPNQSISCYTLLKRVLEGPPKPLSKIRDGIAGELIAICEKAMAREPQARYASTLELAEDLRAFLEHRVVSAYETGTWAETKKWVQRNTPLASAIAAALVIAVGGAVAFSIKANAAERNAAETKEVADFQSKMLSNLSVDEFGHRIAVELEKDLGENLARLGKSTLEIERAKSDLHTLLGLSNVTNVAQRVLEGAVFDPAVQTIEKNYVDRPLLAALLETPLTETLRSLALFELGERAGRAAVAARRTGLSSTDPQTLTSISHLALVLQDEGKHTEAETLLREVLAGRRTSFGNEHLDTLNSMNELALLLQDLDKLNEAEPLFQEALAGFRSTLGDHHYRTLTSVSNLARVLQHQGEFTKAEPLFREALAGFRSELGDEDRHTLTAMGNLAGVLKERGVLTEAKPLYLEALAGKRKKLGDAHPDTLLAINNLALLIQEEGNLTEAEPLYRESLAGKRMKLGDTHSDTLIAINNLARLLQAQGKSTDAEPLYREALAGFRKQFGDEHPSTLATMSNLATLLNDRGKFTEAESLYLEALAVRRKKLGDEHPDTLSLINNLALLLQEEGKYADAEPLFREALAGQRKKLGDDHSDTLTSINNLASLLNLQSKQTEAEPLLREALAGFRKKFGDAHPNTLAANNNLGLLLKAQGKLAEAEPVFREAMEGCRKKLGDEHPNTLSAIGNLASVLKALGKFAEAEPLYREAVAGKRKKLGDDHSETLVSMNNFASLFAAQSKFTEAETLYLEVLTLRRKKLGDEHADTQKSVTALITLYNGWHKKEPGKGHDTQAAEMKKLLKKQ